MITKCEQGRDMKGRGHVWSVSDVPSASGLTELTEGNKSHPTHCQNVYATDDN